MIQEYDPLLTLINKSIVQFVIAYSDYVKW